MKNQSFFTKLFASFSLASGSIWIGAYLVKLFLVYQLFEPKDLVLKEKFLSSDLQNALFVLLPAFVTPFIVYIVFIFSLLMFLFVSRISLKQNGWLFISVIIILITLPFEIYLMLIDYKVISLLMMNTVNSDTILNLIRERITDLSSFTIIEIFSYISILFLIIFKPLTVKDKVV